MGFFVSAIFKIGVKLLHKLQKICKQKNILTRKFYIRFFHNTSLFHFGQFLHILHLFYACLKYFFFCFGWIIFKYAKSIIKILGMYFIYIRSNNKVNFNGMWLIEENDMLEHSHYFYCSSYIYIIILSFFEIIGYGLVVVIKCNISLYHLYISLYISDWNIILMDRTFSQRLQKWDTEQKTKVAESEPLATSDERTGERLGRSCAQVTRATRC